MKNKLGLMIAGISFFCFTMPAIAHHGFDTEYDANKKVKLSGVVTKIEWLNPHMRVYIDVTDAKGNVANWNLELTSPNTVRRQGCRNQGRVGENCQGRESGQTALYCRWT